jgi:hypothetical protein
MLVDAILANPDGLGAEHPGAEVSREESGEDAFARDMRRGAGDTVGARPEERESEPAGHGVPTTYSAFFGWCHQERLGAVP